MAYKTEIAKFGFAATECGALTGKRCPRCRTKMRKGKGWKLDSEGAGCVEIRHCTKCYVTLEMIVRQRTPAEIARLEAGRMRRAQKNMDSIIELFHMLGTGPNKPFKGE